MLDICFALIGYCNDRSNPVLNFLLGKEKLFRYTPVEFSGKKYTEREVSNDWFSNSCSKDKTVEDTGLGEHIEKLFKVDEFRQGYESDMRAANSDIISEYFDRCQNSVTRAEFGTMYHNYFIPKEMSQFVYKRGSRFPKY